MRKTVLLAAIFSLLASSAMAQQVNLNVTTTEAQFILNSLATQPWKDVNPLMQKLIGQVNAQMIPPAPKAEPKTTTPKTSAPPKADEPKATPEAKKNDATEPKK